MNNQDFNIGDYVSFFSHQAGKILKGNIECFIDPETAAVCVAKDSKFRYIYMVSLDRLVKVDKNNNTDNLINMNIIDSIQNTVDAIKEKYYKDDPCIPDFIVSLYEACNSEGEITSHKALLTIDHMGEVRSRVIFPNLKYKYGYESLKDEMKWLYNSTM